MRALSYHRAVAVADALAQHAGAADAQYIAGGTTLIDLVKLDVMQPARVIDLNRLELDAIALLADGALRVGALVRNSDLAWNDVVRGRWPVLAEALLNGASPQIRNMATAAGNLLQRTRCPYFRDGCSPCNKRDPGAGCAALDGYNHSHAILGGSDACIATHPSDMCVALAILDADVVVQGIDRPEHTIAFADFHLLPGETPHREHALETGEVITGLVIRPLPAGTRSWYVKVRDRQSYEFALASAAVALRTDQGKIIEARLALGGVATKPWRARAAEESLRGAPVAVPSFARAADLALRDARPREHNGFKVELARRVIVRAFDLIASAQPAVRQI